jgi:IS1 family transposase
MLIKYGFLKKEKTQRYKCKRCNRFCSDADKRTFATLRSKPDKILMVLKLLTEGMGVRGAARGVGCHRDTVLRILKLAGQRSYNLLQKKLQDVPAKHVEVDEIWTFVQKKSEAGTDPELDMNPWGDFYVFLAIESQSKLLFMPTIGKRSENATWRFSDTLAKSTSGRFQLTSDGFRPYKKCIKECLGNRVDFAQFYKEYNMLQANKKLIKFNQAMKDSQHLFVVRSGKPDKRRITTSHVERLNLSLRMMNRRFNRKTICFSKDEEYLSYSVFRPCPYSRL